MTTKPTEADLISAGDEMAFLIDQIVYLRDLPPTENNINRRVTAWGKLRDARRTWMEMREVIDDGE